MSSSTAIINYKPLFNKGRTDYTSAMSKPREFGMFSQNSARQNFPEEILLKDDSNLNYFHFPEDYILMSTNNDSDDSGSIDLLKGIKKFDNSMALDTTKLDGLLKTIADYEKNKFEGKKLPFELLLTDDSLMSILTSSLVIDNQILNTGDSVNKPSRIFQLVTYDNQIFIKNINMNEANTPISNGEYCKLKFQTCSTLSKPIAEIEPTKIEKRFLKIPNNKHKKFTSVIKQAINKHKVVLSSDSIAVRGPNFVELNSYAGIEDEDVIVDDSFVYNGENLPYYINVDVYKTINNVNEAYQFEKFLFCKWLRAFLTGKDVTVIGFVDEQFKLRGLEEFKTSEIPAFLQKNGKNKDIKFAFKDALNFYGKFIEWLQETLQPSENERYYQLKFENNHWHLIELVDQEIIKRDGFNTVLTSEFKAWRESLRVKTP
ncbi:hypothetical protein QEN19_001161 [Hanseniaspora menglaensis]